MTHKPPVPTASQSPYPLHPAPVRRQRAARPARTSPRAIEEGRPHRPTGLLLGLGLGAIAGAAMLLGRRWHRAG